MPLKKINPTTPGQRFRIGPDFSTLTKTKPEKSLVRGVKRTGGRNNTGKMTMRYRGGGHKRRMRQIDFKRKKHGVPAVVKAISYDPMRTAFIALIYYKDGEKAYIVAPKGLKVGAEILAGQQVPPEIGNAMPLEAMPLGTVVHNVELHPGRGAAMVRSAGASAQLVAIKDDYGVLKLPSGEVRMVLKACMATVGSVSNSEHNRVRLGKAGRKRWMGRTPRTRAVAMNPVDHPMGGGEGKASGGHPRSRKGLYAKGKVTRKNNKHSDRMIISKRKK